MSSEPRLILAVRGEQGERFGSRRQKTFDGEDGSIGRSEECDWVLSAEGVSRLHALVRYLNGIYFIEDRSTNGVLLNGTPLRKGDPAGLTDGDRLQIDAFEVSVQVRVHEDSADRTMWQTPASGPEHHAQPGGPPQEARRDGPVASSPWPEPAPQRDALDGKGAAGVSSLLHGPSYGSTPAGAIGTEGLIPGSADAPLPGASVDPLALLDAPPSYLDEPAAPAPEAPSWNHTSSDADRFRPPRVEVVRHSAPLLPEDWDLSDSQFAPPAKRAVHADIKPAPTLDAEPASVTEPPPVAPERPQVASPAEPLEAQPIPRTYEPARTEPIAAKDDDAREPTLGESFAGAADMNIEPAMPRPTGTPPSSGPVARAAHAEPSDRADAPASPHEPAPTPARESTHEPTSTPTKSEPHEAQLEQMFHIVIDGLMDVLRARAELKNSFRLPATLIQRAENNPLKFAPNADEAVKKLLAPPNSAFLSGSAALNDAVSDIRNHQMAMLAGVRSAFQSLLAQFDPARIEHETGGSARRLPFGQGQRNWERYKEQFDAMTRNPDESFRRLFGDEFARAYEEQLARLKSGRG
ncbi:type VI secretion system-associated FHA domain protein TagH [Paraburkholderia rhizosphaerae]|uniref:FHA domain protein n=1 Tax=Paraburkholderia rhizosphaerae TaxID=480658 RepID=A0A4R8M0J2_9BURK|nr:type VI secretion system-associated FHA domain protein TagH [Paraburkholderia rhizosphaerae]TDY52753.1 FHA domain protein [Paraburkholderia rhizosphaerae]